MQANAAGWWGVESNVSAREVNLGGPDPSPTAGLHGEPRELVCKLLHAWFRPFLFKSTEKALCLLLAFWK